MHQVSVLITNLFPSLASLQFFSVPMHWRVTAGNEFRFFVFTGSLLLNMGFLPVCSEQYLQFSKIGRFTEKFFCIVLLYFSSGRGEIFHKQSAFSSCMRGTPFNWKLADDLESHQTSYRIGRCSESYASFHLKCVQCHCKDSAIVMATAAVPPPSTQPCRKRSPIAPSP